MLNTWIYIYIYVCIEEKSLTHELSLLEQEKSIETNLDYNLDV